MKVLRFKDLQDAGLVSSWTALKHLIEKNGFPVGRYLSANTRVWTDEEVDEWVLSRPLATEPVAAKRGAAARLARTQRAQAGDA